MGFNYTQLDLPSRFIPYPEKKGKVGIRTMVGADEERVMLSPENDLTKTLISVVQDTLTGVEDIKELTDGDILYIALWHAINSYSPDYSVEIKCDGCNYVYVHNVDLTGINVDQLDETAPTELTITLPKLEKEVIIRCPVAKDGFSPTIEFVEDAPTSIYDIISNITRWKVSQSDDTFDSRQIPVFDLRHIAKTLEETYRHGPDLLFGHTCPECKKEQRSALPFRFDYVIRSSYAF